MTKNISGNYAESVERLLFPRKELVERAIATMQGIVAVHLELDDTGEGKQARTRRAPLKRDMPEKTAWFDLFSRSGERLKKEDIAEVGSVEQAVGSAALQYARGGESATVFTVQVDPPNVFGFDGAPLAMDRIGEVIGCMIHHKAALDGSSNE